MLKMLIDPMGGIQLTNDGNAILRELDVSHPSAKSLIENARSQDEEVGDGTTSVIVLAGELLSVATPFIEHSKATSSSLHPTQIVRAYHTAYDVAVEVCDRLARPVDFNDTDAVLGVLRSCIGTKFTARWKDDLIIRMALDAVRKITVVADPKTKRLEIDYKRYVRIEKIPGGEENECRVMNGIMLNKDVTHSKMRRRIENPKILLLDCSLEYKKGESQTSVEVTSETDWEKLLKLEEEYVLNLCNDIIKSGCDLVFTEKGVSDLAQHYLYKAGITAIRRLRKTDNNRLARATGATIVGRTDEIQSSDLGLKCGLFEVVKIGDEYFCLIDECRDPKSCTIILRGGSKDVLNEIERNLQDALQVARNIAFEPKVLPGGGATEMAVARATHERALRVDSVEHWPLRAAGKAFEVIPRTLAENCGADVVRVLTELRALHAAASAANTACFHGIDGLSGKIVDMADPARANNAVWDPYAVKIQCFKTAIGSASMLLRIDDILSGVAPAKR